MPLHVWLPRAHPIAPAPVSALMSGVMIKVALYGLVRVLVEWVGVLPVWFGVLVLARRRALGGRRRRLRALPARPEAAAGAALDRERRDHRARRSAPAWSCARAAPTPGRRSRSARRSCTRSTTRSSRRCSSSARARSSGRPARSSSTGSAGCCGGCRGRPAPSSSAAMAIAGLPPLNGFASEWLTLQALLHVAAYGAASATASPARSRWRRSPRPPRSPSSASSRSSGSCCSGRRGRAAAPRPSEAPLPMRAARRAARRRLRRARPGAGPALRRARRARALAGRLRRRRPGSTLPGTGSLPDVWIAVVARRAHRRCWRSCAGRERAAPAPTWACGQRVEPALRWTSAGFTKPLRLVLEARAAPAAGDRGAQRGRRRAGGLLHAATCRS